MPSKHFSIINVPNMSLMAVEELEKIYELLRKHRVTLTTITPGQRLAVYGMSPEKLRTLQDEISAIFPVDESIKVTSLQSCPGLGQCRYAVADSLMLGRKIDRLTFDHPLPHKVKVAIAGCRMCCTEPYVRDVGILAGRKGWSVLFGGNAGGRPRIADLLASGLQEDEVVALAKKALDFYIENAGRKQRTARFLEQFGIDEFRKALLISKNDH